MQFELPTALKATSVGHRYDVYGHPWEATSKISNYMTFSEEDSITPWHVDFGSTTVWYLLLYGVKEFYLIRPTPQNRKIFKSFNSRADRRYGVYGVVTTYSANTQSCVFSAIYFPSLKGIEGRAHKMTLYPGMSIILPAGMIHAVRTIATSVAFGANILQEHDMLSTLGKLLIIVVEYNLENYLLFTCVAATAIDEYRADRESLVSYDECYPDFDALGAQLLSDYYRQSCDNRVIPTDKMTQLARLFATLRDPSLYKRGCRTFSELLSEMKNYVSNILLLIILY